MTRIKICGITRAEDAECAALCGVDAIGLIFAPSPRTIEVSSARDIVRSLGSYVLTVGVFLNQEIEEVRDIYEQCGLDRIQFHGSESPESLEQFGGAAYRAFTASGALSDDIIEPYLQASFGRTFLLDQSKGEEALPLEEHWRLCQRLSRSGQLILAGGLDSTNIEEALRAVEPRGVDLSRGVEESPGIKSHDAIRELTERVRAWKS